MNSLTSQIVVILVNLGLCSSLFYTNSRENDYPRIGKRPSFFLRSPLRNYITQSRSLYGDDNISEGPEKFPLVEPEGDLEFLQEAQMDTGVEAPADVDGSSVVRSPGQRNKLFVMYDDSDSYKEALRKHPWAFRRRQPVWE